MPHTIILASDHQRQLAHGIIDKAPQGYVVEVKEPKRTLDQNAKLWAMLGDISRSKPKGRVHPPETWKALFMHACGFEVAFQMGLNGEPFPVGWRTSRLSKGQMADLITFIQAWGDEHGIAWQERHPDQRGAA